jgi:hypothetical protein
MQLQDVSKKALAGLKRFRFETLFFGVLSLVVLAVAVSLVLFYAVPRGHSARLDHALERLPYPIAFVGFSEPVTERALSADMASVRRFYESQDFSQIGLRVDFSNEEGEKRLKVKEKEVFNKMIEDRASEVLGRKYGIHITEEAAHQGVERTLAEYGSKDSVASDLERLYGWNLADFEEKIVVPSLYKEKLEEVFRNETKDSDQSKERIETAQKELTAGGNFGDIAKKYSDGQTKGEGGELGWFRLDDLAPELQAAVPTQKVGTPGSVIESALGYHILLVEETKNEQGTVLYRLAQIFTRKADFGAWLQDKMEDLHLFVLSVEYRWKQAVGEVDFRSSEVLDFEKNMYENQNGDALFFL